MFKTVLVPFVMVVLILGSVYPAMADDVKADVGKVMEMVLNGVTVVDELGEESFSEFDDPNGEFVWQSTAGGTNNVGVGDCVQGVIVADPAAKGLGFSEVKDATGRLLLKEACELVSDKGSWMEYKWPDESRNGDISRSILFCVKVPNSNYFVWATEWDDVTSMDELNAMVK